MPASVIDDREDPSLEGLYKQGDFGLIIEGGVWLRPRRARVVFAVFGWPVTNLSADRARETT